MYYGQSICMRYMIRGHPCFGICSIPIRLTTALTTLMGPPTLPEHFQITPTSIGFVSEKCKIRGTVEPFKVEASSKTVEAQSDPSIGIQWASILIFHGGTLQGNLLMLREGPHRHLGAAGFQGQPQASNGNPYKYSQKR